MDIVHLHCLWVSSTVLGARICEVLGVPYVVGPRGCLNRWALDQKRWKKRAYMALAEARTLRKAAGLHFTSAAERDEVGSDVRVLPHVVVPNAIRLDDLLDIPLLDGVPEVMKFLIVGRIHPVKGFDVLLPALAAVRRAGHEFTLAVAGGDEGGYEATVRRLAAEHGVAGRITFLGRLDRPQLAEQLARATAVLVPSYQESFGMAAAEGMAAARPVVVAEGVQHLR